MSGPLRFARPRRSNIRYNASKRQSLERFEVVGFTSGLIVVRFRWYDGFEVVFWFLSGA